MDPDIHTPDEEGFIPFIHNYCDRWCERCRFVDRCRVGYEELDAEKGGFKQRTDEEAMREAAENMRKTMEMVEAMMREQGIDPDELRRELEQEEQESPREKRKKEVREHPLSLDARDYAVAMMRWTKDHDAAIQEAFHQLAAKADLGVDPEAQMAMAERLSDALELLSRYGMPIGSKTERALMGRKEDVEEGDDDDPHQSDANGSAKVSRIFMERSLASWAQVLEVAPSLTDAALPLMARLERIHKLLVQEFPHTDQFIRPGFDAPAGG